MTIQNICVFGSCFGMQVVILVSDTIVFLLLFSSIILTFASQEKTSILRLAVYVYDVINKVGMCG